MLVLLACSCRAPSEEAGRSAAKHADGSASPEESPGRAADVVRAYYHAIDEGRYEDAYRAWSQDGRMSGQSFEEFQAGFASTASVQVEVGTPGRVEGAAGSRYVDVPVRIQARRTNGAREELAGTYTLRRSVVDGATPAQRAWHIEFARIRPVD
jgi:hypothetical protein